MSKPAKTKRVGRFTIRPGKGGQHWESWMVTDGLDYKLVGVYSSFEEGVLSAHQLNKDIAERRKKNLEAYREGEIAFERGMKFHDLDKANSTTIKTYEESKGRTRKGQNTDHPWARSIPHKEKP
jgi:hypothetical protein